MRQSKFSEDDIVKILNKRSAHMSLDEICKKYAISKGTYYKWRSQYGDMKLSSSLRRIKLLEAKNKRLKNLYAKICLEKKILQDAIEGKL